MTKCLLCNNIAKFNYKNNPPRYCIVHRKNKMCDTRSKLCEDELCYKRANFNFKKPAIFCNKHKLKGMVNVNIKKCNKCNKKPSYGYIFPILCKIHKEKNMKDFTNKLCFCGKIARFGYYSKQYCTRHKLYDMHDFNKKNKINELSNKFLKLKINNNEDNILCLNG